MVSAAPPHDVNYIFYSFFVCFHERSCQSVLTDRMWKPTPAAGRLAAAACLVVTGMLVVTGGHPTDTPAAASVFSAYIRRLARERRHVSGPPRSNTPPPRVEQLSQADLFIAVKSTGRYHGPRLQLLLDTWISRSAQQVSGCTPAQVCHCLFLEQNSLKYRKSWTRRARDTGNFT